VNLVQHTVSCLMTSFVVMAAMGSIPCGAEEQTDEPSVLGAINVPFEDFQRFVDLDYDLIARIRSVDEFDMTPEAIHATLEEHGIEHFGIGPSGQVRISKMRLENVPPERRGLKRGPGRNKYTNLDTVCAGWDEPYRFRGNQVAREFGNRPESGVILEDFLNRALCYCAACEEDFCQATGRPGFPKLVYQTPHYEDTVAFDPGLLAWDQARTAHHFRLLAAPIHAVGKKIAVAGTCRWIVGSEAAAEVDHVMFYTYYAGRRLPPNYMRNWKYWHDHEIPNNLWVIFGYFREFHTCHTRLMLANLPDGVNLAFWALYRQAEDPDCREDALYARDVVSSSLIPIRIGVYDPKAAASCRGPVSEDGRRVQVDRAVIGFERLGFDAAPKPEERSDEPPPPMLCAPSLPAADPFRPYGPEEQQQRSLSEKRRRAERGARPGAPPFGRKWRICAAKRVPITPCRLDWPIIRRLPLAGRPSGRERRKLKPHNSWERAILISAACSITGAFEARLQCALHCWSQLSLVEGMIGLFGQSGKGEVQDTDHTRGASTRSRIRQSDAGAAECLRRHGKEAARDMGS